MFVLTSIAWPYRGLRYRPTEFECFLKLSADKLLLLKWWQAQVQFFKNVYQISRVHKRSHTFKILISNWPRTWKFNRLLHALKARRFWLFSLSRVDHALRPIFHVVIGQILTGEFMRKIYAASENLFTDSWSWQSFVSSCDVLNCLFLLDVQNEIQLLSRLFCNSWLVCLLRFLLTNAPLVKVIGNPISDGIVFKNELTHLPLLEA